MNVIKSLLRAIMYLSGDVDKGTEARVSGATQSI